MATFEGQWTKTKESMRIFPHWTGHGAAIFSGFRTGDRTVSAGDTSTHRSKKPSLPNTPHPPQGRLSPYRIPPRAHKVRASWSTGQTHNARCGVSETGGEGRLTASAWFRAPRALCISSARGSGVRPSPRRKPRERKPPSPYYDGYFVLATKCSVTGQDTRRFEFRSPQSSAVFFRARPIELACLRDAPGPRERWRVIMASTAPPDAARGVLLGFPAGLDDVASGRLEFQAADVTSLHMSFRLVAPRTTWPCPSGINLCLARADKRRPCPRFRLQSIGS